MGLWDLKATPGGLERVTTPLVGRYREIVEAGVKFVGTIGGNGEAQSAERARQNENEQQQDQSPRDVHNRTRRAS